MNSETNKCRGYGAEGSRKGKNSMAVDYRMKKKKKKTLELGGFDANLTVNLSSDYHMI
jgi:hypothetical protein